MTQDIIDSLDFVEEGFFVREEKIKEICADDDEASRCRLAKLVKERNEWLKDLCKKESKNELCVRYLRAKERFERNEKLNIEEQKRLAEERKKAEQKRRREQARKSKAPAKGPVKIIGEENREYMSAEDCKEDPKNPMCLSESERASREEWLRGLCQRMPRAKICSTLSKQGK